MSDNYFIEASEYQSITTHERAESFYYGLSEHDYRMVVVILNQKGGHGVSPSPCARAALNLRLITVRDGTIWWVRDAHLRAAYLALTPNGPDSLQSQHPLIWEVLTREHTLVMSGDQVARLRNAQLGLVAEQDDDGSEQVTSPD